MTEQLKGWFEVLYRRQPVRCIKNEREIQAEDYVMAGSRFPFSEYSKPFEIYESLADDVSNSFGLQRTIQEYDILNIVSVNHRRIVSLLVINKEKIDKQTSAGLRYLGCRIQVTETRPLGLLTLKHPFHSFSA